MDSSEYHDKLVSNESSPEGNDDVDDSKKLEEEIPEQHQGISVDFSEVLQNSAEKIDINDIEDINVRNFYEKNPDIFKLIQCIYGDFNSNYIENLHSNESNNNTTSQVAQNSFTNNIGGKKNNSIGDEQFKKEPINEILSNISDPGDFKNFLCSEKGINIIKKEIDNFGEKKKLSGKSLSNELKSRFILQVKYSSNIDNFDSINNIIDNINTLLGEYAKKGRNDDLNSLGEKLNKLVTNTDYDKISILEEYININIDNIININEIEGQAKEIANKNRVILRKNIKNRRNGKENFQSYSTIINSLDIKSNTKLKGFLLLSDFINDKLDTTSVPKDRISRQFEIFLLNNGLIEKQDTTKNINEELIKRQLEAREKAEKRRKEIENKKEVANSIVHEEKNKPEILNEKDNSGIKKLDSGIELASGITKEVNNIMDTSPEKKGIDDFALNHIAFHTARPAFLNSNSDLRVIITDNEMESMLNLSDLSFCSKDSEQWKNFTEKFLDGKSEDQINIIYNKLSSFSNYIRKSKEALNSKGDYRLKQIKDIVTTHAVGGIIDNINNIFYNLNEENQIGKGKEVNQNLKLSGFILDSKSPVSISGNDMLISGKFNGTNVKVRYDLFTGKLYINSFIGKDTSGAIILGGDIPNNEVGEIKPLKDILENYYNKPPFTLKENTNQAFYGPMGYSYNNNHIIRNHSSPHIDTDSQDVKIPDYQITHNDNHLKGMEKSKKENIDRFKKLFGENMNNVSNKIKSHLEDSGTKNDCIRKFTSTFNLTNPDKPGKEEIYEQRNDNPRAYKILNVLYESDKDTIQAITSFSQRACEYSGLSRGFNNNYQNLETDKAKELFSINSDSSYINSMKNNMGNFTWENMGIVDLLYDACKDNKNDLGEIKINKRCLDDFRNKFEADLALNKELLSV